MNVRTVFLRGSETTAQGRGLRTLLACLVFHWPATTGLGRDAVFTNDGQRIYAIDYADNK